MGSSTLCTKWEWGLVHCTTVRVQIKMFRQCVFDGWNVKPGHKDISNFVILYYDVMSDGPKSVLNIQD